MKHFIPKKEDFLYATIWIIMYSLPQELWHGEILDVIGNNLGIHIKNEKATRERCYTSYAWIYVYMNISKPL